MNLLQETVESVKAEIKAETQEDIDRANLRMTKHYQILDDLIKDCSIITDEQIDEHCVKDAVEKNEEGIITIENRDIKCIWTASELVRAEGHKKFDAIREEAKFLLRQNRLGLSSNQTGINKALLMKKLSYMEDQTDAIAEEFSEKTGVYLIAFWRAVKQIIQQTISDCPDHIGIRTDWQVVKCPEEESLSDMFSNIGTISIGFSSAGARL